MRAGIRYHRRGATAVLTAALTVSLGLTAGCGGTDDDTPSATSAAAPARAETTPAADDGCAAALPEIQASLTAMRDITSVEVPSCDKAVVTTSLGTDEADVAAGVCQNAANEASSHGVASVSVVTADGEELAAGTSAEDCAAVGS